MEFHIQLAFRFCNSPCSLLHIWKYNSLRPFRKWQCSRGFLLAFLWPGRLQSVFKARQSRHTAVAVCRARCQHSSVSFCEADRLCHHWETKNFEKENHLHFCASFEILKRSVFTIKDLFKEAGVIKQRKRLVLGNVQRQIMGYMTVWKCAIVNAFVYKSCSCSKILDPCKIL